MSSRIQVVGDLSSSASWRRSTLPVGVVGNSWRNTTRSGCVNPEVLAHMGAQVLRVRGDVGDRHHDGHHDLAPLGVLDTDDGDVTHVRMFDEDVLDLGRSDVLTAADDGVVGSPTDEQVAVGVEVGDILGREPASSSSTEPISA